MSGKHHGCDNLLSDRASTIHHRAGYCYWQDYGKESTMIDFPAAPTIGQTFSAAGIAWTWDGAKWTPGGSSTAYLPLGGGTLTGPLTLAGNPVNPLDAATKQYVDAPIYPRDNRIINGDMRIDQRNNGAATTPLTGVYVIDRWRYAATQTSKMSFQRGAGASGLLQFGFGYFLSAVVAAAFTPTATDFFQILQSIEADIISDFAFGTPNAQPITLSFWAHSSTTAGTFSGSVTNTDGTRSYPFTFTIPILNTWMKFAITIPGDTVGTWVLQGNGIGATVHFDYGSGANFRGPAGAWASANYVGANGANSIIATAGAILNITGVKLEIGNAATPFNRQSLAKSLADCQRYYQILDNIVTNGYGGVANSAFYASFPFPTRMRGQPTAVISATSYNNAQTLAVNAIQPSSLMTLANIMSAGTGWGIGTFSMSAEF
jgi:hypothetical protein